MLHSVRLSPHNAYSFPSRIHTTCSRPDNLVCCCHDPFFSKIYYFLILFTILLFSFPWALDLWLRLLHPSQQNLNILYAWRRKEKVGYTILRRKKNSFCYNAYCLPSHYLSVSCAHFLKKQDNFLSLPDYSWFSLTWDLHAFLSVININQVEILSRSTKGKGL